MIRFFSDSDSDEELDDNIQKHNCYVNNCNFCTSDIMKLFIHNHNHLKEKKLLCLKPKYIIEGGDKRKRETSSFSSDSDEEYDSDEFSPKKYKEYDSQEPLSQRYDEDDILDLEKFYSELKDYKKANEIIENDDDTDPFFYELEKDIVTGQIGEPNKSPLPYDYIGKMRVHGQEAIKIAKMLYEIVDKSKLTDYQKTFLRNTLHLGIHKSICLNNNVLHASEFILLWNISSGKQRSTNIKDLLSDVLKNGVVTPGGRFVSDTPRQFKTTYDGNEFYYRYEIINYLIENYKDEVLETFDTILDEWLGLLEDLDSVETYVCHEGYPYTLNQIIKLFGDTKKINPITRKIYTFKELYDTLIEDEFSEIDWRYVFDIWKNNYLETVDELY
tara:strand:- start:1950 stop:3107 length:1158 start_codon:yes stop_codon:yes gene_type:complete